MLWDTQFVSSYFIFMIYLQVCTQKLRCEENNGVWWKMHPQKLIAMKQLTLQLKIFEVVLSFCSIEESVVIEEDWMFPRSNFFYNAFQDRHSDRLQHVLQYYAHSKL